jgi:biotin carboxylase
MTVLVLHHRGSLAASPYDRWLADYDGDVLLLCSREGLDLVGENLPTEHGYRHAEAIVGYETAGRVEARVRELALEYRIEYIVNCQEFDLERAAQLREILGLPGQRPASVEPFRNKVAMKDALRAAGIPVAEYRAVECATDLVAFAGEQGFPLVVKPRNGAGSVGVRIVRSAVELDELIGGDLGLYGELRSNLMVESFVPGPMFHVDGLVVDGRLALAWPSRYLFVEADFAADRAGRLDVALDRDDPLAGRLLAFADRVLAALPSPPTFAFHAEVFLTPDGSLVLCEVACRTGGAAIREVLRGLFTVDVNEWWVRAAAGLSLPVAPARLPLAPGLVAGQVFFTKRPGTVRGLPGRPPFPWVAKATVVVRAGQVLPAAGYTSDALAFFIVTAPDRAETERRLRQVETWFLSELVIDQDGPAELPVAS